MIASDTPTDKLFAPLPRYLEAYRAFTAASARMSSAICGAATPTASTASASTFKD
jgi:hypothetical protein